VEIHEAADLTRKGEAMSAIPLRIGPTDLRRLLRDDLLALQAQAAGAGVTLTVSVGDTVPARLEVDAEKLGWAVTTLVGNALRYVRHATRHRTGGTIAVAVTSDAATSRIAIEVADDGPGIVDETAKRLFRHDDPRGPSGLALLLVHDIIAAHGGSVSVESSTDPGNSGTTIRLTLPCKRPA
jgi:signal transduction histidine kinase